MLLAFFKEHGPGAKGALIVNSVAAAHRLVERLQPAFAREHLTVMPNTGLTGAAMRKASREADLLVGTSTVDVGVDFRINFLVFESRDASTFLQRLGRLGRHESDGHGHAFEAFAAHALVPGFVYERLATGRGGAPALLHEGDTLTRERLSDVMSAAYCSPFEFRSYAREWGWVQSAHVFCGLFNPKVRDTYAGARDWLRSHYRNCFGISIGKAMHDYNALRGAARQIVEEAQSFRGDSPFDCGIIDESRLAGGGAGNAVAGDDARDRVKRYDLMMLAANADLEWLGPEEFGRLARREWGGADRDRHRGDGRLVSPARPRPGAQEGGRAAQPGSRGVGGG